MAQWTDDGNDVLAMMSAGAELMPQLTRRSEGYSSSVYDPSVYLEHKHMI